MNKFRLHIMALVAIFAFQAACFSDPAEFEVKVFKIQHTSPATLKATAETLKSKDGKVSVHESSRSLIVLDYPENIERIGEVIRKLDIREEQVRITVRVAEVTDTFLTAVGVLPDQLVIPRSEFDLVARLIKVDSDAEITSEMTVMAMSNRPAQIRAADEVVFEETVTRYGDDREVMSFSRKPVGSILTVTPRINNDGTIEIAVKPTMGSFTGEDDIYERTMETEVLINDGDTVMIGGVDQDRRDSGSLGIPYTGADAGRYEGAVARRTVIFLTAEIAG